MCQIQHLLSCLGSHTHFNLKTQMYMCGDFRKRQTEYLVMGVVTFMFAHLEFPMCWNPCLTFSFGQWSYLLSSLNQHDVLRRREGHSSKVMCHEEISTLSKSSLLQINKKWNWFMHNKSLLCYAMFSWLISFTNHSFTAYDLKTAGNLYKNMGLLLRFCFFLSTNSPVTC